MNRWMIQAFALPALSLGGFGFAYLMPLGMENSSQFQLAQTGLPWATEEKKPATPKSAPSPAPVPKKAPSSQADQADKKSAAGPGWAVNCKSAAGDKGLSCRVSQTVVAKETGRLLINVAFLTTAERKSLEVLLQLPLGLYLPAGATYQIDGNPPQRVEFRACNNNGCYARGPVSPETLAALKNGKQLKIDFKNLAENPVSLPLSLEGFAEAYAKVQRL